MSSTLVTLQQKKVVNIPLLFLMLFLVYMEFVSFPERNDGIFKSLGSSLHKSVEVEASGSMGRIVNGKCIQTFPNETLIESARSEWCSNIVSRGQENPWISYRIKNKAIRATGYSVRNGCCYFICCCTDDETVLDYDCCCELYSFSIEGSNDNKTWKNIHSVQKDSTIRFCEVKTFKFQEKTEPFKYIRFKQDEARPGCPICIQINQVELYGETIDLGLTNYEGMMDENDESVSIIGKINRNRRE
jgi:hypothetical protein